MHALNVPVDRSLSSALAVVVSSNSSTTRGIGGTGPVSLDGSRPAPLGRPIVNESYGGVCLPVLRDSRQG